MFILFFSLWHHYTLVYILLKPTFSCLFIVRSLSANGLRHKCTAFLRAEWTPIQIGVAIVQSDLHSNFLDRQTLAINCGISPAPYIMYMKDCHLFNATSVRLFFWSHPKRIFIAPWRTLCMDLDGLIADWNIGIGPLGSKNRLQQTLWRYLVSC